MKKKIYFTAIIALTLQIANAQWAQVSSNLASGRTIFRMSAHGSSDCYGIAGSDDGSANQDVTFTHDGGATWQSVTIADLADNYIIDIFASSKTTAHVIGWNYVTGGGNVFKTTDGGQTWKREAANAFTNPASFPDDVAFFNASHGVMFGDAVDEQYEIYTTSDKGKHWHQVANTIEPLSDEYGGSCLLEVYGNTVWAVILALDVDGNIANARLVQSDDRGATWYVRNASLPAGTSGFSFSFRDESIGLINTDGKLYRTTDGGTSFTEVNYTGTIFPLDIEITQTVGGSGFLVSAGGSFCTVPSVSSVTFDDGDNWYTIDTDVAHGCLAMVNERHGFTGGVSSDSGDDGVFYWAGSSLKQDAVVACDELVLNIYPNPTSETFSLMLTSVTDEVCNLSLYDMQGRLVLNQKFAPNEIFSFGNDLTPGLYLAQIISGNEKRSARLIKQ